MVTPNFLNNLLRNLRLHYRPTQTSCMVCAEAGIPRVYYSNMEHGRVHRPQWNRIKALLVDVYNCDTAVITAIKRVHKLVKAKPSLDDDMDVSNAKRKLAAAFKVTNIPRTRLVLPRYEVVCYANIYLHTEAYGIVHGTANSEAIIEFYCQFAKLNKPT